MQSRKKLELLNRCLCRFSLEGTPASVDSLGIVRLLNRSLGNTWSVVANTKIQVILFLPVPKI
jgi:hypothetical protein